LNVDSHEDMLAYAEKNLPSQIKRDMAKKHARLFMINANKVASDVGLPGRTNNILILFYFRFGMQGLINFEDAVDDMKLAAKKTYAKRGQAVIDSNIKAIEQSVAVIDKCAVNYDFEKWAALEVKHQVEKLN
jgi:pyruvate-ferredoxin/flavodoxin oxidoreductase